MQTVPYLYFNGNAQEAMVFYVTALKAELQSVMHYKDQPSPGMPAEYADKIMHAVMLAEGSTFYVSDALGGNGVKVGDNVQINLNCDSEEQLRWIYNHLSEGAQIKMKLQTTFWDSIFAMLTDKFGISWSLNYQITQPDSSRIMNS